MIILRLILSNSEKVEDNQSVPNEPWENRQSALISSADKTIPVDSIFRIKRLTHEFKAAIAQAQTIDSTTLAEFERLNPELYATHEILGDYHYSQSDTAAARREWNTALLKFVPKTSERERIEKKLKRLD